MDLSPSLAEVCMHLHLRFVCFHFNLEKALRCGRDSCQKHVFNNMEAFLTHWVYVYTHRRYACLLCYCMILFINAYRSCYDQVVYLSRLTRRFSTQSMNFDIRACEENYLTFFKC